MSKKNTPINITSPSSPQSTKSRTSRRDAPAISSPKHPEFELTYDMMLGIRTVVGKTEAQVHHKELQSKDFTEVVKLKFPSYGSTLTPAHSMRNFKFKDYSPQVYRSIREQSGINPADYLLCVCGNFQYLEFISNSKSGEFFFYTHDRRFMIKTVTQAECKFLQTILPDYYAHLQKYPHSLLTRFYGMHRVKPHKKSERHFLIMGSVFNTPKYIHKVFDIKGARQGRQASAKEVARGDPVYKDNDLVNQNITINIGTERAKILNHRISNDVEFLRSLNIMDYSLLLGIHYKDLVEEPTSTSNQTSVNNNINRITNNPPSTSGAGNVNSNTTADNATQSGNPHVGEPKTIRNSTSAHSSPLTSLPDTITEEQDSSPSEPLNHHSQAEGSVATLTEPQNPVSTNLSTQLHRTLDLTISPYLDPSVTLSISETSVSAPRIHLDINDHYISDDHPPADATTQHHQVSASPSNSQPISTALKIDINIEPYDQPPQLSSNKPVGSPALQGQIGLSSTGELNEIGGLSTSSSFDNTKDLRLSIDPNLNVHDHNQSPKSPNSHSNSHALSVTSIPNTPEPRRQSNYGLPKHYNLKSKPSDVGLLAPEFDQLPVSFHLDSPKHRTAPSFFITASATPSIIATSPILGNLGSPTMPSNPNSGSASLPLSTASVIISSDEQAQQKTPVVNSDNDTANEKASIPPFNLSAKVEPLVEQRPIAVSVSHSQSISLVDTKTLPASVSLILPTNSSLDKGIKTIDENFIDLFTNHGGLESIEIGGKPGNEIYFLGIIDFLNVYGVKKYMENRIKRVKYDRNAISVVSPRKYAERFKKFLSAAIA